MIRTSTLFFFFLITLLSCHDVDEDILPLVGIYRAHIVGVAGPFDLIVSTDRSDDVLMEAPFDGFEWYIVKADIDNQTERVMDIQIDRQNIASFTNMKGSGFFRDGNIELNYTIDFDGEAVHFKLVGTKL